MSHILRRAPRRAAAALAVAVTLGLSLSGVAAADTAPAPAPLSSQEKALLKSDAPKTAEIDPTTGEVISLTPGIVRPTISNHNFCNTNDGCYYSGRVPYAHQGFYGSAGTATGNWPYRSGYYTGQYTARVCWTAACTQSSLPPNTEAYFTGGTLVTGTSFRIY